MGGCCALLSAAFVVSALVIRGGGGTYDCTSRLASGLLCGSLVVSSFPVGSFIRIKRAWVLM